MAFSQKMPLHFFYTMVQKSKKWPKTQIKGGGGGPALIAISWRRLSFPAPKSGTFFLPKKVKAGFWNRKTASFEDPVWLPLFVPHSSPFSGITLDNQIQLSANASALKSLSKSWINLSFPDSQQKSRGEQKKKMKPASKSRRTNFSRGHTKGTGAQNSSPKSD